MPPHLLLHAIDDRCQTVSRTPRRSKAQRPTQELAAMTNMHTPPVVPRQAWDAALAQLLVKEKAQTRARDALSNGGGVITVRARDALISG